MDLLRQGSKGTEVSQIQQFLKGLGYYTGRVDGIYGPRTNEAVKLFQQQAGIRVDGIVGPETRGAISQFQQNPNLKLAIDPLIQALAEGDERLANTLYELYQEGGNREDLIGAYYSAQENQAMKGIEGYDLTITPENAKDVFDIVYKEADPYYKETLDLARRDFELDTRNYLDDYSSFLSEVEETLPIEKERLDTNEAQSGTLFSTGRVQRRQNLANEYNRNIDARRRNLEYLLGKRGNTFEGTFGSKEAGRFDYGAPTGNVSGDLRYRSGGLRDAFNPLGDVTGTQQRDRNKGALRDAYNRLTI